MILRTRILYRLDTSYLPRCAIFAQYGDPMLYFWLGELYIASTIRILMVVPNMHSDLIRILKNKFVVGSIFQTSMDSVFRRLDPSKRWFLLWTSDGVIALDATLSLIRELILILHTGSRHYGQRLDFFDKRFLSGRHPISIAWTFCITLCAEGYWFSCRHLNPDYDFYGQKSNLLVRSLSSKSNGLPRKLYLTMPFLVG